RLTSFPRSLSSAKHHLLWAREHWRRLAEVADKHYAPLLESLRMHTQAYRWESQLAVLDGDLAYLASIEQTWAAGSSTPPLPPLAHLPGRGAQVKDSLPAHAMWPVQWRGTGFKSVTVEQQPALRSQGGQLAFDVDDLLMNNVDADLALDVAYWDSGPGTNRHLRVEFDSVAKPYGALETGGEIALGGSRGWHRAQFALNHARLSGGGPGNTDILITSSDTGEFVVQSPAIRVIRAPSPTLDLHIAKASRQTLSKPLINWRRPGGTWQTSALKPGLGEAGVEGGSVPRGREFFRFEIPAGVDALEYYFSAALGSETHRLPKGEEFFRWSGRAETNPPTIALVPNADTPTQEGSIKLQARVTDPSGVARVVLHYKPIPTQKLWSSMEMTLGADGVYLASVPLTSEGLLYRFVAWDKLGNAATYPNFIVETPYRIIPSWDSTTPASVTPTISSP
ncbi:MAG: hypothetical protein PSW75_03110, partial [bacterium]|nr:hypothetical protein [bacterium]